MIAIDISISEHDLMEIIFNEGYPLLPVYNGSIDNIVGVLYVKDLLNILCVSAASCIGKLIRPGYFVPETKKINRLLKQFQRRHLHMAIATE